MKVNGLYLDATPEQIIQKLTFELEEEQGRFLFRRTKSLGSNMQFSCPFHGDGMERHPSCGMSRDVSYPGSRIIEAGTVHCFTCGYTAKLNEFVSDLFNRKDGGFFGNQWLKRNFSSGEEQVRPLMDLGLSRKTRADSSRSFQIIPEDELDKYRWTHPYMYQRKLTDDIIELFDVGYDKLNDCITTPGIS